MFFLMKEKSFLLENKVFKEQPAAENI